MADLDYLISKAKSGQLDPLAALIKAMAGDLRAFISTYVASRAMADEAHAATWLQVRKEFASFPQNAHGITWVRQRAMTMMRNLLDIENSAAIAARSGLRHLVAQDGIESLSALVTPNNESAALLNRRYMALDTASQLLLSRRYGDSATLRELGSEAGTSDVEVANRLFSARAGLHWRVTDAERRPPDDPHLAVAIDQHLSDQLDAPGRQNLGAMLMKDFGHATAFTRQVRVDLMLHAVFGSYTDEDARKVAALLVDVEYKRRNESSLLQVVAPPRTPIGSGTELRMASDRIADRQIAKPSSSPSATATTRPNRGSRTSTHVRRGSRDENLLTSETPRLGIKKNRSLLIGAAIATVGVLGLMVIWNGSNGTASEFGQPSFVATVVTTKGDAQVITATGSQSATPGWVFAIGDGFDSAHGETTIEMNGTARIVATEGTQVKSFDALPDRTGQVHLTKGTLQIQVSALPGVEVVTAQARVTLGIGRGQVSAEPNRTLVHAQSGKVVVTNADNVGAMQMTVDQRVEITAGANPRVLKPSSFVRGINLGGNAVTIDRNRWLSHREALSAGLSLGAGTTIAPVSMISGTGLDFDRKTMLDTGLTGSGAPVQVTQKLPDGAYELTLWLTNTASLDAAQIRLTVNNQQIPFANKFLMRDTWAQLGPLPIRASDDRIEISLGGQGVARVSGLALSASNGDELPLPASVVITSPVEGISFFRGEEIHVRAETVGKLSAVQFYSGTQLLGESSNEPYRVVIDNLPAGQHRIFAKALNLRGEPSVSLPLSFSVIEAGGTGSILIQYWTNIPGLNLDVLKGNTNIDGPPQESVEATSFTAPQNWGNNYYCRMRGYVHPPFTGDYIFWMVSDDEGELLLSTSADPSLAKRIAHNPSNLREGEWTKRSSQESKPIPLVAGQKYYIELRYKEHDGDDRGACGWKFPDGTMDRPISGLHLSPFKP